MDDFASFSLGILAWVIAAGLIWRERQSYLFHQRQRAKGKDLRP